MAHDVGSRVGMWNQWYEGRDYERAVYSDPKTAEMAGEWLNVPSIKVVEDWGCGYGGFKNYIAPHQTYVGIDGSNSRFADRIEDLTKYRSKVDAVHLRHVLEHNPAWRDILDNFLDSFTQRAVLTLFTPLVQSETTIATYKNFNNTGFDMVDISLSEADLYRHFSRFPELKIKSETNLITRSQYNVEHMYFFKRGD